MINCYPKEKNSVFNNSLLDKDLPDFPIYIQDYPKLPKAKPASEIIKLAASQELLCLTIGGAAR